MKAQDDAGLVRLLGCLYVGRCLHGHNEIGIPVKSLPPPYDVLYGLAEIFQDGAGAVDSGQAPAAHVFKNGFTPVADLQTINYSCRLMHGA